MGSTGTTYSSPSSLRVASSTRRVARWILLVAALHVALAAPGLSDSVWLDEAVTIQLCRLPLSLDTTTANDATPPVYYLLIHAWGALFGCEVTGIRILSLVLSALSGALLLALGSTWFNLQTGVVAAVLFSASNLQLHYATEARCYTLVELLLLVSYWSFFELRESAQRSTAIVLGIVNATIVQTHYVAALGLLPQLVDVALFRWRERDVRTRYVRSQLLAVALCVPWATYVALHWPPITPLWLSLPDAATLDYNFRLLLATPLKPLWYVLAVVVMLAATFVRTLDRLRHGAVERLTVLAAWGIGVPVVAYAVSQSISVVLPRYLLFASLGLWLLLGYVVSLAPARGWRRVLLIAVVVAPTVLNVAEVPMARPDWRHAIGIVKEHSDPTSSQIVVSPEWEAVTIAYYLIDPARMESFDDVTGSLGFEGVRAARDPDEAIAQLSERIRTVILVTAETNDHVVVLSMPQMCFFRERFTAHPTQLYVRVLDRDCAIE